MPGSSILLIYTACCFLLPTVSNVPLGHSAVQQTACCWLGFWAASSVCLLPVQDAQAFLRTLLEAVQRTNGSIGHPPFMFVLWYFNTVFIASLFLLCGKKLCSKQFATNMNYQNYLWQILNLFEVKISVFPLTSVDVVSVLRCRL